MTTDTSESQTRARASSERDRTTRKLVRGSSLLLTGRLLSKFVNFAVQVLIVRSLSQGAYGAFAYALSIVLLVQSLSALGMGRAVTRFVPIYHEKQDWDRLFGTFLVVPGTILGLGLSLALLLHAGQGLIGATLIQDELALSLLLVMIFLAPVQALDETLIGLFASFASARSIFYRKHVLAPLLKLSVVLALTLGGYGVRFLATGYVIVSAAGVAIYSVMLWRILARRGLFEHFRRETLKLPFREILSFSIPLMTTDLVFVVMNTVDAMLLAHWHDSVAVAQLRAVQPAAKMNQLVMASFGTLFMPTAARLFARDDREGISSLYWQSAVWIAVISFPVFAVTFSLAKPFTLLLYGARYEQSAVILAMLSLGYYFNASLGFNGLTIKVFGKVRYMVMMNVATAALNLGLNLWLIPRYGAVGAATGTLSALVFHNVMKQTGLRRYTGIDLFEWKYAQVYLTITLGAAGLFAMQMLAGPPVGVAIAAAALVSLGILRINRRRITLGRTFPEILRLPGMRWLLSE